jgi:ankyrin repeat protein
MKTLRVTDPTHPLNAPDGSGETPLTKAIWKATHSPRIGVAELRSLLDQGADPNARKGPRLDVHDSARASEIKMASHSAPLHDAVGFGLVLAAKVLLRYGANPNIQDAYGITPLNNLAGTAREDWPAKNRIGRTLLTAGADPNIPNINGETPLHGTASQGNATLAKELLDHGANPNAQFRAASSPSNSYGPLSPLHLAYGTVYDCPGARFGEVQRLLEAHGADQNLKAAGDRTPKECADLKRTDFGAASLMSPDDKIPLEQLRAEDAVWNRRIANISTRSIGSMQRSLTNGVSQAPVKGAPVK